MICQQDSYLRECTCVVHSCVQTENGYMVETSSTLLYPMGGGQPSDHGWLGDVRIVDVQKHNGTVLYYTQESVELGQAHVRIDWERRFDFMQQHTGQHLLTALIVKEFGWMTVGFHIGPDVSTIDLETAKITQKQQDRIVRMVNEAILEQRAVRAIEVTREEFSSMDIRSRGVPDWVDGPIRLIDIEGVDRNNCGGTHVSNTAQLQMFGIVGLERMKNKTRLTFVYGGRLLSMFQGFLHTKAMLNDIFQSGEHVLRATNWAQDRKEHKKQKKIWNQYRAEQEGNRLALSEGNTMISYCEHMDLGMLKDIIRHILQKKSECFIFLFSESVFAAYTENPEQHRCIMDAIRALGGRGGGRIPTIQGKWSIEIEREQIKSRIQSLIRDGDSTS